MHGAAYANWAVSGEFKKTTNDDGSVEVEQIAEGADLLLAFGVRFDDRVTGKVEKFCEKGTIVHVDIDPSEHNKNRKANLPVVSDVMHFKGDCIMPPDGMDSVTWLKGGMKGAKCD